MADKQLRVIIVGDAKSVQKAFQDTEQGAAKAEVKVEGFGKTFAKLGAAFGVGASAGDIAVDVFKAGVAAVGEYTQTVDAAEKKILGITKSQQALTEAQRVAQQAQDDGLGTYQETIQALATLTPLANQYNASIGDVLKTTQLLAALDPEQGLEGARVALSNALAGQFESLSERFEIPRTAIQKLKDEGVPNLQIVQRALKDLGIDEEYLATANDTTAKKIEILQGRITQLAVVASKPVVDGLTNALGDLDDAAGNNRALLLAKDIGIFFATLGTMLDGVAKGLDALAVGSDIAGIAVRKAVVDALAGVGDLLANLPGGIGAAFRGMGEGLRAESQRLGADLVADQSEWAANLDEAGRLWAQAAATQWASAGEATGKGYKQGLESTAPTISAALRAAGEQALQSFLNGLTSAQVGDFDTFAKQFEDLFKVDPGQFKQATVVLARALQDIKDTGQLTAKTFYDLTAIFGDNALNVATLTVRYGEQVAAQERATAASEALAASQKRQQQAINDLANELKPYQTALDNATAAAKNHADAATAALEPLQEKLGDVADAASDAARRNADAIDALQDAQASHAAANAAAEAQAQAELTAIQERRREETEKLYDSIVDGARRALDAENNRVNALSAKAHKDDLDKLRAIQAALDAGDPKEAARLRRQLAAQKKKRQGAEELAAAEQAVAQDEFNAADKAADKAVERKDKEIAKEEEAAQAKLTAIQEAAKSQAAADAAAIKGAQDAAKAEADRYAAQQRGIQDEIDGIRDAAAEQAKKDSADITAAQKKFNDQKTFNDKIAIQLGGINHWEELRAGNAKDTATASKETYDWITKIYDRYKDNPPGSPGGPPTPTGATGGGVDARSGASQASGAPSAEQVAAANRQAGINNWLAYYGPYNAGPAMSLDYTPPDFHVEPGATGPWWVRNGYALDPSGTVALPTSQSSSSGGRGGSAFLRAAGTGGTGVDGPGLPSGAQGGQVINLHINAPNLTNVGSAAQQRALAGQAGEALRTWRSVRRGGATA